MPSALPASALGRWVVRYGEHLAVRGYSKTTIQSAGAILGLFVEWCDERGIREPEEVTPPILERYQRHLYHFRRKNGKPLSFRTQHNRLTHVRSLFRWLVRERVLLYNPAAELELPKYSRRLPAQTLSAEEAEQVLASVEIGTPAGLRDRAILETFYSTGMRRSELVGLDVWDVEIERSLVVIRYGKGDRDRVVPIGERALAWVVKYLEDVRPSQVIRADERALFVSSLGERFALEGMTHLVNRYVRKSGVPKQGSCHLFRHSMATLMLEGGADIRYIQEMLGHAKLETTQIYTRVSIRQLQAIHQATHPAAGRRRRAAEAGAAEGLEDGDAEETSAMADAEVGDDLEEGVEDPARADPIPS